MNGHISRDLKNCENEEISDGFLSEAEFSSKEVVHNITRQASDNKYFNYLKEIKLSSTPTLNYSVEEKLCGHPSKVEGALVYR